MSFRTKTALRETAKDLTIVAAVAFWAAIIGFAPVVAMHAFA